MPDCTLFRIESQRSVRGTGSETALNQCALYTGVDGPKECQNCTFLPSIPP